jgi:hypothetical protein
VQREKGFLRRRALKCWEGKLEADRSTGQAWNEMGDSDQEWGLHGILEMAGVTIESQDCTKWWEGRKWEADGLVKRGTKQGKVIRKEAYMGF